MSENRIDGDLLGFLENVFVVTNDVIIRTEVSALRPLPTDWFQSSDHDIVVCHIGELALIRQVIISYNADEALAFLSSNRFRFPDIGTVSVVALGLKPAFQHAQILKTIFPVASWILIFSADIPGHCADIIIAAGFHQLPVAIYLQDDSIVRLRFRTSDYLIPADSLTLYAFEKAVKRRFGIRTYKPRKASGFNLQAGPEMNSK